MKIAPRIAMTVGLILAPMTIAALVAGARAAEAAPTNPHGVQGPHLTAVSTESAAIEAQRQALARQQPSAPTGTGGVRTAAAADQIVCWSHVRIQRYGLSLLVSMENNFTGNRQYELRARTAVNAAGPWEMFGVCRDLGTRATNFVSEQNGLMVTAEAAYTGSISGMLRARTTVSAAGPWELFYTDTNPGTGFCTQIKANANNLFVAAEERYSGNDQEMLRARTPASGIGNWETFCW